MLFNKRITLFLPEHTQLSRPFFPFQSHPFLQFLQFLHRRRCQIVIKGSSPDLIRRVNMVLINELIRASPCMVLHVNILYIPLPSAGNFVCYIPLPYYLVFNRAISGTAPDSCSALTRSFHGITPALSHSGIPPYHLARFPLCLLARFFSPASRFCLRRNSLYTRFICASVISFKSSTPAALQAVAIIFCNRSLRVVPSYNPAFSKYPATLAITCFLNLSIRSSSPSLFVIRFMSSIIFLYTFGARSYNSLSDVPPEYWHTTSSFVAPGILPSNS